MDTAQDMLNEIFLEDDNGSSNATLDLLRFMKYEGTALTENQLKAMFILKENGLDDLAQLAVHNRKFVTPKEVFFKLIDKLTLADRIKGNAKLSHLVKSTATGNPAEALNPKDVQAQGMSRKEIDRYA